MELIVFDLDGTLLNANSQISPYTRETLELLADKKIAYTVATGRTLHSAQDILAGHDFNLPHIYSNGVLIWDPRLDSLSMENLLTIAEAQHVIRAAQDQNITPFISSVTANKDHRVYHTAVNSEQEERLLNTFHLRGDISTLPLEQLSNDTLITNISVLGEAHRIESIEADIANEATLVAYSGTAIEGNGLKWMDVHHSDASKGGAVQVLREQLGISKLLCFGDNDNDLSMFAMADECYAPDNANERVKAAATAVIGHHDADGIARYLRERFNL